MQDHRAGYGAFAQSMSEGKHAEECFRAWAEDQGFLVKATTADDNKRAHVDFIVCTPDGKRRVAVDVKAVKRRERSGSVDGKTIWLEAHGETHPGWVFGKADVIAVREANGNWLLLPRVELAKFVMEKVPHPIVPGCVVTNVKDASDTVFYQRKGKERLLLAKTADLRPLALRALFV
jgi:hypothetical protein